MITYQFDNNILFVRFSETVTLEDIIEYLKEFDQLDYLPKDLQLLYDLTNTKLNIAPTEIKIISQIADASTHGYNSTRTAFLVESPKIAAYSTLFLKSTENPKTKRNIFSTKDAALKWLNSFKKENQ